MNNFLISVLGAFIGVEIGELLWTLIFESMVKKLIKSVRWFSKNVLK